MVLKIWWLPLVLHKRRVCSLWAAQCCRYITLCVSPTILHSLFTRPWTHTSFLHVSFSSSSFATKFLSVEQEFHEYTLFKTFKQTKQKASLVFSYFDNFSPAVRRGGIFLKGIFCAFPIGIKWQPQSICGWGGGGLRIRWRDFWRAWKLSVALVLILTIDSSRATYHQTSHREIRWSGKVLLDPKHACSYSAISLWQLIDHH